MLTLDQSKKDVVVVSEKQVPERENFASRSMQHDSPTDSTTQAPGLLLRSPSARNILQMQRTMGNQATIQFLSRTALQRNGQPEKTPGSDPQSKAGNGLWVTVNVKGSESIQAIVELVLMQAYKLNAEEAKEMAKGSTWANFPENIQPGPLKVWVGTDTQKSQSEEPHQEKEQHNEGSSASTPPNDPKRAELGAAHHNQLIQLPQTIQSITALLKKSLGNIDRVSITETVKSAIDKVNLLFDGNKISIGNGMLSIDGDKVSIGNGLLSIDGDKVSIGNGLLSIDGDKVSVSDGALVVDKDKVSIGNGMLSIDGDKVSIGNGMLSIDGDKVSIGNGMLSIDGDKVSISATEQTSQTPNTQSRLDHVRDSLSGRRSAGELGLQSDQAPAGREVPEPARHESDKIRGEDIPWKDESAFMSAEARDYQAGASGARSNIETRTPQAPVLTYTDTSGKAKEVRLDGVEGDVVIDRKRAVVTTAKGKKQAMNQSEAFRQNGLTGRWEVPTAAEVRRAEKMFRELGITNIEVKVVEK